LEGRSAGDDRRNAPMTAIGVEHASLVIEVLVYTALVLAAVACVRGGLHEQRAAIAVAFCVVLSFVAVRRALDAGMCAAVGDYAWVVGVPALRYTMLATMHAGDLSDETMSMYRGLNGVLLGWGVGLVYCHANPVFVIFAGFMYMTPMAAQIL
jgi:hypothetical protein